MSFVLLHRERGFSKIVSTLKMVSATQARALPRASTSCSIWFINPRINPAPWRSQYLVIYLRRSGSDPQLSPWLEGRNHIHPAVHRVQDAIAADLTKSWSLRALARLAGASDRHLSRLFHEHVGMSIPEYSNRLRVAYAQELLRETRFDMERVAEQSGFSSTRQLRRAWERIHKTPPREARLHSHANGASTRSN